MSVDREFWEKANREKRMKQAHIDVQKSGTSKVGFGEFERRMLTRDQLRKKEAYEQRRIKLK